nr:hypothetical protein [Liquorilactobacillus satsumensis]
MTFLFFDGGVQPIGSFIFGFFINIWQQWTYVILGCCLVVFLFAIIMFKKRKLCGDGISC